MEAKIVARLLALNERFYAAMAGPFADSRRHPQPGYERLLSYLPAGARRLLDVGCGHGRWGQFLLARGAIQEYVGVDFNPTLLAQAAERTGGEFYRRDLSRPNCLADLGEFEAVACLSVAQHIPGRANRLRLLAEMGERLGEGGRLFLANWQFAGSPRQRRKIVAWSAVGLSDEDVEPGDYLLSWRRGGEGLRYAALIDAQETARLAADAGLVVVDQFRSDGREGNLNLYTILRAGSLS